MMDLQIIKAWALAIVNTEATLLHECAHYTALSETIVEFESKDTAIEYANTNGIAIINGEEYDEII